MYLRWLLKSRSSRITWSWKDCSQRNGSKASMLGCFFRNLFPMPAIVRPTEGENIYSRLREIQWFDWFAKKPFASNSAWSSKYSILLLEWSVNGNDHTLGTSHADQNAQFLTMLQIHLKNFAKNLFLKIRNPLVRDTCQEIRRSRKMNALLAVAMHGCVVWV